MSQENMLEIRHLSKAFGKHVVLRDIDFNVKPGDVTCIIGASGSGKSTLLRCINLLEPPSGLLLQQGQQRPGVRGAEQGLQPLPVLQQLPGSRDLAENIWVVLLFHGRSSIDLRYEPERCGIPGHPPPSTVYGIP